MQKMTRTRLAALTVAALLGACTANGGLDDGSSNGGGGGNGNGGGGNGGGGNGSGDGSGGDCLLSAGGICIIGGPGTSLPNYTCTGTASGAQVNYGTSGLLCTVAAPLEGCIVYDPQLAADGNFDTFAGIDYTVAALDPLLAGSVTMVVPTPSVPAGRVASFLVSFPGGTVDASVLRGLTVTSSLAGAEQETMTFDTLLGIDVLGLVGDSGKVLVGYPNTKPYDQLSLTVDAAAASADVFEAVNVYEACTNAVATP